MKFVTRQAAITQFFSALYWCWFIITNSPGLIRSDNNRWRDVQKGYFTLSLALNEKSWNFKWEDRRPSLAHKYCIRDSLRFDISFLTYWVSRAAYLMYSLCYPQYPTISSCMFTQSKASVYFLIYIYLEFMKILWWIRNSMSGRYVRFGVLWDKKCLGVGWGLWKLNRWDEEDTGPSLGLTWRFAFVGFVVQYMCPKSGTRSTVQQQEDGGVGAVTSFCYDGVTAPLILLSKSALPSIISAAFLTRTIISVFGNEFYLGE